LAVPAGRARLLSIKYVVVVFALTASAIVAGVSFAFGAARFAAGPVTLLSGTTVRLADGLLQLPFVTPYVAAGMAALGAIGLAISTLPEHPVASIAPVLVPVRSSVISGCARSHIPPAA